MGAKNGKQKCSPCILRPDGSAYLAKDDNCPICFTDATDEGIIITQAEAKKLSKKTIQNDECVKVSQNDCSIYDLRIE